MSAGGTDLDQSISAEITDRLEAQEPSESEKAELRAAHRHHLVRATTSELSIEPDVDGAGIRAEATATIPDLYCFTCSEWVGLSGVDLRGTPRSRADAYYLGGPPTDVRYAREKTESTLTRLVEQVERHVDTIETRADAIEFVASELERLADD